MGKWCLHASSFIFDQIVIKVAGNQDRHKSSDEFDFGPLVSMTHLYVFEMRFDLGTLDSGERSLPFGLLVLSIDENLCLVFVPENSWDGSVGQEEDKRIGRDDCQGRSQKIIVLMKTVLKTAKMRPYSSKFHAFTSDFWASVLVARGLQVARKFKIIWLK